MKVTRSQITSHINLVSEDLSLLVCILKSWNSDVSEVKGRAKGRVTCKYWWSLVISETSCETKLSLLFTISHSVTAHQIVWEQDRGPYIFVKLREREGQRVDLGRSLKGHLWMVDGGWWISFPWCFTLKLVATTTHHHHQKFNLT